MVYEILDNMWAICGSAVDCLDASRIVGCHKFNMPIIAVREPAFYPNLLLAI
jgi:hypothetical protein